MGFNCLKDRATLRRQFTFYYYVSSQKFLVFILLTSEGRKTEPTLDPPSGLQHRYPGLRIQHLDHTTFVTRNNEDENE